MKKLGFFIVPLIMILMFTVVMPRLLTSGMSPASMVLVAGGLILLMSLIRPKKAATKSGSAVAEEILDDFCAGAFDGDQALKNKFEASLNDIGSNMPKSAVSRLAKLEALCTSKEQRYAVALAAAQAWRKQQKYREAVQEYNKALVLHPTGKLAALIGDCQQRQGNLSKAKDSYEFASELEPENAQHLSSLATVYVADRQYRLGLETALDALELEENLAQALATCSICYGLLNDTTMHEHYLELAVNNGYKAEKIRETVKALKK